LSGPLSAPGELRTVADLAFLGADRRTGDLDIDLQDVRWVAPAGVVALLAQCLGAQRVGRRAAVRLPRDPDVLAYFDRIGMYDELVENGWSVAPGALAPADYRIHHHVPVMRITDFAELEELGNRLEGALRAAGLGNLTEPIFTVASELSGNARDHGSDCYAVLQTHTGRSSGTPGVHLAVADFGPGFAANLRPVLGDLPAEECIARAFKEGVTSRKEPYRGYGLHHVALAIAGIPGASIEIASGGGLVRLAGSRLDARTFTELPFTVASASFPVPLPDTEVGHGAAPER